MEELTAFDILGGSESYRSTHGVAEAYQPRFHVGKIAASIFCFMKFIYFSGPRVFGDKLPRHVLLPDTKHVQKKIVVYHNFFRSHVQPTASDMLAMVMGETFSGYTVQRK